MELISIIVPVYNVEKYLQRCIESLISQTYKNIEIILVNDGSTDNSGEICRAYAQKYKNIVLIEKENEGISVARNTGIEIAKGSYISFVDSDDYIQNIFIERLYNLCKKNNSEVAICDFERTQQNNLNFTLLDQTGDEKVSTPEEMMFRCCNKNKTKETLAWNKLYKKELFSDIRYPKGRIYEDLATTHKVLYKANLISECNDKMYAYYMSDNSITRKKYSLRHFECENMAQNERLEFFKNTGNIELYNKALISIQRNRIANYCKCCLELADCKEEQNNLLTIIRRDEKKIRNWKNMDFQDKILFALFRISPMLCVKILWPFYMKRERKRLKGI